MASKLEILAAYDAVPGGEKGAMLRRDCPNSGTSPSGAKCRRQATQPANAKPELVAKALNELWSSRYKNCTARHRALAAYSRTRVQRCSSHAGGIVSARVATNRYSIEPV